MVLILFTDIVPYNKVYFYITSHIIWFIFMQPNFQDDDKDGSMSETSETSPLSPQAVSFIQ